jgi:molybdate transport system substrate-binding protein
MIVLLRAPFFIAAIFALVVAAQPAIAQDRLTIFAAASMKNALDDVDAAFTQSTGIEVSASYAGTSALVKQIEAGAPADIFLSADSEWMEYAQAHKLIDLGTRFNLLGNRLVLIAPVASRIDAIHIEPGMDLASYAGDSRIATGDVQAVPVGRYAKAALMALGCWENVAPKLLMAENVRAALVLVARREVALGIVYETDAKVEPKVKVVARFPDGFFAPIVYPVARTAGGAPLAGKYLDFLRSDVARAIFENYGFSYLAKAGR